MSSKRTVALMAILLVLVLVLATRTLWERHDEPHFASAAAEPRPGKSAITSSRVVRRDNGAWIAEVDYEYNGLPPGAFLRVDLAQTPTAASAPALRPSYEGVPVQPGRHHVTLEVKRPLGPATPIRTDAVVVKLMGGQGQISSIVTDVVIEWPDNETWWRDQEYRAQPPETHFANAVALIDHGRAQGLGDAKRLLERLIAGNPQHDAAFVELARIAMKSNWGPEGLRQAENLVNSARQIRPDSVNAKILLGYIYAHQGRHKQAEALFAESAQTDTKNLWLWANWGEVLVMQGRLDAGIEKYREAIKRPRSHDTYDRARLDAYRNLLALLDRRQDSAGVEALHRQRATEYGPGSCYSADYARFLVHVRGDAAGALAFARAAVAGQCGNDEGRAVLGLVHYMTWLAASGPTRDESLRQARVYLPAGPSLMYELASSDRTVAAARALKSKGEPVDLADSRGYNALAYAMDRQELGTARRLLRLGAKVDTPIGPERMPVALLPVVSGSIGGIRLMQEFGVDYGRLTFQGMTAIDHARRTGDKRLLDVLDPGARKS
jgi:tetratricopeptide (TPR) repeat protein